MEKGICNLSSQKCSLQGAKDSNPSKFKDLLFSDNYWITFGLARFSEFVESERWLARKLGVGERERGMGISRVNTNFYFLVIQSPFLGLSNMISIKIIANNK